MGEASPSGPRCSPLSKVPGANVVVLKYFAEKNCYIIPKYRHNIDFPKLVKIAQNQK
jgi:hypothetical protein